MEEEVKKTETKTSDDKRQKRRYVRLEVFSPVGFHTLIIDKDKRVRSHPDRNAGILLNLSGGGALISTADTASTNDLVLLNFEIKGFETLTNILGRIKRVEECEDGERLIGIEFLTPEQIEDPVLAQNLARLSGNPMGFSEGLKRLVSRYVFQRQIDSDSV